MVSRQDVRTVNEANSKLQEALDEMQELTEAAEQDGVTVDPSAYRAAQDKAKAAIADMSVATNDAIDRTDVYEPDGEESSPVDLPDAALERDGSNTTLPSNSN